MSAPIVSIQTNNVPVSVQTSNPPVSVQASKTLFTIGLSGEIAENITWDSGFTWDSGLNWDYNTGMGRPPIVVLKQNISIQVL